MIDRAVKIAGVVAWSTVATQLVLDVKLSVLAVFLGFVMLLAILDETSSALQRRVLAIRLGLGLTGLVVPAFVQLLDQSRVRLVAVLTFGMGLRALLLPIPHRSILL